MSQHPSDPYRTPQTAPPTRSLPRRDMRETNRGPFTPPATALTSQRSQQSLELAQRYELLNRLGVPPVANEDFDELARDMATQAGFLYGFVNLFLEEQTFVGLHQPPADSGFVIVGRTMSRDHGWCPEVMARRKALPLHDVHASPRFSGNAVVDAVGIRAYFGAPLIHDSGTVLGTVCVIDPEKRPLAEARRLRDIVINASAQVMDHITRAPVR
ncbi:GAF domain-containing protein [Streptomyces sp. ME02-6987-2C]|uniref:GAF domain-containing protein n=1 Tax=unclassified Streptomyces TaxID=2593676 RepID=UPI0029A7F431|nr:MULTISPECIES: GAF domain-containing protein [unclassified Streptomyces]MDX3366494.1 GAF domain-containing protein [Streptomyces sp. ME02-6987-2C]MDX3424579.1 GAF domain-containing protein [Streptomyces sp. ME02-6985-2c]